jgi:hypothetical protein
MKKILETESMIAWKPEGEEQKNYKEDFENADKKWIVEMGDFKFKMLGFHLAILKGKDNKECRFFYKVKGIDVLYYADDKVPEEFIKDFKENALKEMEKHFNVAFNFIDMRKEIIPNMVESAKMIERQEKESKGK